MAFEPLPHKPPSASAQPPIRPDEVRVGIRSHFMNRGQMSGRTTYRLRIVIGHAIAARLGWTDGEKVEVGFGTDEHAGLLRITRSARGAALTQPKRAKTKFFVVAVLPPPDASPHMASVAPETAHHEVMKEAGWLTITIPKRVRASMAAPVAEPTDDAAE